MNKENLSTPLSQATFCYLGVKSEYSMVDGSMKLDDYLAKLVERGHRYASLVDNGGLFGALDFYLKCQQKDITPIIGSTLYMEPSPYLTDFFQQYFPPEYQQIRSVTPSSNEFARELMNTLPQPPSFQLTLLAKDNDGYRTLTRLVSAAYESLVDDIPLCSWSLIEKFLTPSDRSHLFILSGTTHGELTYLFHLQKIFQEHKDHPQCQGIYRALQNIPGSYVKHLQNLGGQDGLYLELFHHGFNYEGELREYIAGLAAQLAIPLVASADAYYLNAEDHDSHMIALAIKNSLAESDLHTRQHDSCFHLFDHDEFQAIFHAYPEAVANTMVIAESCRHLNWDLSHHHLPSFPLPEKINENDWLEKLAWDGLNTRITTTDDTYTQRLNYELKVIKDMGYSGYFLIVQDFIQWSKSQNIAVGPGRGSGAGSLVAFALGITDIDPLRWGLLFERFLNPERVSLPDFDIDFCQWRREEVIDYIVSKYGTDKVSHICSFGKLMAKAALKNTARVLGVHYLKMNQLTKMFPDDMTLSLQEVIEDQPEIAKEIAADNTLQRAVNEAYKLEGMIAHTSIHPAGIVISDRPISDDVPTFQTSRDMCVASQFEMKSLEKVGLVKFDFLGLKTLTVIDLACRHIQQRSQPSFTIENIALDDTKVYEDLTHGHTTGVFQAESGGMTALMKKLQPSRFEDIIALVALFRPGPLGSGMVDDFIERKHGRQDIAYLHPLLQPILADTYGMIVYQEQVQRIASDLACYSLGEADLLRRAMGKKIPKEMSKQKKRFLAGAKSQGIDDKLADRIFELMAEFAKYGFNKSHSAAYGLILYQTAYLKTYYPHEFLLSLMTCDSDNPKKMQNYITECHRLNMRIQPPSLAQSHIDFSLSDDNEIRYAFEAIKGVSKKLLRSVITAREKAPFKDLLDFCHRCNLQEVGKKNLELLISVGAFDEFGYPRRALMPRVAKMVKYNEQLHTRNSSKQPSLLSLMTGQTHEVHQNKPSWLEEIEKDSPLVPLVGVSDLIQEKNLLGTYLSAHPMDFFKQEKNFLGMPKSLKDITQKFTGQPEATKGYYKPPKEHLVVFLEHQYERVSMNGQKSLRLILDDKNETIEGVIYDPETIPKIPQNHRFVVISGYLQQRKYPLFVIRSIEDAKEVLATKDFHLAFCPPHSDQSLDSFSWLKPLAKRLHELTKQHPGTVKLFFYLRTSHAQMVWDLNISLAKQTILEVILPNLPSSLTCQIFKDNKKIA
ncbi:MAG: DNA polymerase III subunit alpha [Proteobacteria bacterium]|nr:DNA polymerase III subunit alpha [Pseudomonadota bacterium]